MFVYSFKSSVLKKIGAAAFLVCLAAVAAMLAFSAGGEEAVVKNVDAIRYDAGTNNERLEFISQFGWEVNEEPAEVREIIIPAEFDETYENYNALQLSQSLDLSGYCGKRVKRWTYIIKNYPDIPADDETIRFNMIVYKDKVIGGDVCSIKLDGFMHGFAKE